MIELEAGIPLAEDLRDIDSAGLRLITCGGYNHRTGDYENNTVVFAELLATRPARPAA